MILTTLYLAGAKNTDKRMMMEQERERERVCVWHEEVMRWSCCIVALNDVRGMWAVGSVSTRSDGSRLLEETYNPKPYFLCRRLKQPALKWIFFVMVRIISRHHKKILGVTINLFLLVHAGKKV
jgi:hypothetical protein